MVFPFSAFAEVFPSSILGRLVVLMMIGDVFGGVRVMVMLADFRPVFGGDGVDGSGRVVAGVVVTGVLVVMADNGVVLILAGDVIRAVGIAKQCMLELGLARLL